MDTDLVTALALRAAVCSDADALGAVHVASWRETYDGLLPGEMLSALSVEERAAMWRDVLDDPDRSNCIAVVVVEDGHHIVGFGACGRQRDTTLTAAGFGGEITAIYLPRSHQCRGGGRAILAALSQALGAAGYRAAALWVLRENAAARSFFERLGGSIVGERTEALDGVILEEAAYGWRDISVVTG